MSNICDLNLGTLNFSNKPTLTIMYVYTTKEWIVYQIIWPCIILLGLATNASFIWTVFRTPSLHTCTYRYLFNLAVMDLLQIVAFFFSQIICYQVSPFREKPLVLSLVHLFSLLASTGTVTIVSLERYLAICYPIKHRLIKGTRRTNKMIMSSWLVGICLTLPLLPISRTTTLCIIWANNGSAYADYPNQLTAIEYPHWTYDLTIAIHFLLYIFLGILSNVLFIKIYLAVKRRKNKDLGLNLSSDVQLRQLANMLIVNGVFFFFCCSLVISNIPILLLSKYLINDINPWFIVVWDIVGNILMGLNASINPVLYLITNKRYRHAFVTVFTWSTNNRQSEHGVNCIELPNIQRI